MDFEQYQEEVAAWRQMLDDSLRRENGWLALAGLFWLEEGENTFGSDPVNTIVVPGDVAAHLGVFRLAAGTITLHVAPEADVRINEEKVQDALIQPDSSDSPTLVTVGQVAMMVLQREAIYAIRLWDNGRSQRHTFPGRQWYPLQPTYRFTATFTPSETPEVMTMSRSQGADFEDHPVGTINFTFAGKEHNLLAFKGQKDRLFLPFKDATSGQGTYKAGRYLTAVAPQNGTTTLDFNLAYHPPCTFTPYAVCTLPPRQNWLDIAIEAGEHL
jgi:uncharacterized protein (DUF1684 family)